MPNTQSAKGNPASKRMGNKNLQARRQNSWNRAQAKKGQPGKANHREPMSDLQKVLMGKGAVASLPPVQCAPWMGQQTCPVGNFDPVQAEKNRIAGHWR